MNKQKLVAAAKREYTGRVGLIYTFARHSRLMSLEDREMALRLVRAEKDISQEVRFMFACFILVMAGEEI